jgi:hypothetical protein
VNLSLEQWREIASDERCPDRARSQRGAS